MPCVQRQGHSVFEFNTDESQCLRWLGSQPATSRRNVGMARPPQQPKGGIASRRHLVCSGAAQGVLCVKPRACAISVPSLRPPAAMALSNGGTPFHNAPHPFHNAPHPHSERPHLAGEFLGRRGPGGAVLLLPTCPIVGL